MSDVNGDDTQYIAPQLPPVPFMLQYPDQPAPAGPYRSDEFLPLEDGSNIVRYTPPAGSSTFLRVVHQSGTQLLTHDGDGNEQELSILPLPDNTLSMDGADAGSLSDTQREAIAQRTGAQT